MINVSHTDIAGRIRAGTAAAHKTLEDQPALKKLLSPDVSPGDYIHYLQLISYYHQLVECRSFPLLQNTISDLEDRKKTTLLRLDLDTLGAGMPVLPNDEHTYSIPFHLGMVYVSEGSSLGGMVMMKHLKQAPGTHNMPFHFLNCYQSEAALMWRKFIAQLQRFSEDCTAREQDEIVAGALHGFQLNLNLFS